MPTEPPTPTETPQPPPAPTRTRAPTLPFTSTPTSLDPLYTRAPTWTQPPHITIQPATLTPADTLDPTLAALCERPQEACELFIRRAPRSGWCALESAPKTCGLLYDYSLHYPANWTISTTGIIYPNLGFETDLPTAQVALYQLPAGNLTLENAEKVQVCNKNQKCTPLLALTEIETNRRIKIVGNRKLLILTTQAETGLITRYFLFRQHPLPKITTIVPDEEMQAEENRPTETQPDGSPTPTPMLEDWRLYIAEIHYPADLAESKDLLALLKKVEILMASIQVTP